MHCQLALAFIALHVALAFMIYAQEFCTFFLLSYCILLFAFMFMQAHTLSRPRHNTTVISAIINLRGPDLMYGQTVDDTTANGKIASMCEHVCGMCVYASACV